MKICMINAIKKIAYLTILGGIMSVNVETVVAEDLGVSLKNEFSALMKEIDKRNVPYVDEAIHKDYHDSFVFKGSPGAYSSSKKDYLSFLSEGKIGGVERTVAIKNIEFLDQFGIVRSNLESKVMKFDGIYTFIREDNKWKLLKAILVAEKK